MKKNRTILWVAGGILLIGTAILLIARNKNKQGKGGLFKGKVKAEDWANDKNFFTNAEGKNLSDLGNQVGVKLKRNKGLGGNFNEEKYKSNKNNSKVYWAVFDISKNKLIASSKNASQNIYGASVPKVVVSASAFDNNKGILPSSSDYQKVIKLLVNSDNNVWTDIQNLAGGGKAVNDWDKKMGYTMQSARGMGNNANAEDMCKFWNDVLRNNFRGAENIFKISSSCNTDSSRGRKCMPTNLFMGGKTGTYDKSNHDSCWIMDGNNFYSITVLTELGANGSDVIAQMFRGLYNEYIK